MNRPLIATLALSLATFGCQNKMYDQNKDLRSQNIEQQERIRALEGELSARPDAASVSTLQSQLSERDRMIAELETKLQQPSAETPQNERSSFGDIEVTRDDRAGTLTVNLPGDVLFASGDSAVKSSAKATLDKVAAAIKKDYAGKKIFVDGHSDSDPIRRTKDKYEDNLDLSAARARTVAAYLATQGIDGKLIGARAMADTAPKANKAASRRVEIVVATR